MSLAATQPQPPAAELRLNETMQPEIFSGEIPLQKIPLQDIRLREIRLHDRQVWQAARLRLLWDHRSLLLRTTTIGLVASGLLAFLLPRSYISTTQLMPPDTQSSSSLAMMASMAAKGAGGLGSMASDLLGINSTGALFVGILRSDTAQARLVAQFDLQKVYRARLEQDARAALDERTIISEDRKSGIISISVTDRSPQRAAVLAQAYVDQLNSLIAELSISSAHRERVFLEERLQVAKLDLDDASNQLAQFSSQNSSVDVQTMGRAALDAAGRVAGELIAAESQLEGLRQVYSDKNPRVRSLVGRVTELRKQLEKLDGSNVTSVPLDRARSSGRRTAEEDGLYSDMRGNDTTASEMPYPSLHNLPLLGVKYADYYRRAKIQETVYELLTEQYELTKIQEVKETPSVKVLDRPKVAQKKSSPPRMLVTLLGTFFTFCGGVVWVVAFVTWQTADRQDPRRILAQEVFSAVKAKIPWALRNGGLDGGNANSPQKIGTP
jgi:capsule polysaccharide export protein KpsE/RkpR